MEIVAGGGGISQRILRAAAREPSVCLVPLPNSAEAYPPALLLPYDNTRGYVSSMAFANLSESARTLEVEFLDESGVVAYTLQQPMGPKAHAAFETTNYAAVQGKKGVARVKQNAGECLAARRANQLPLAVEVFAKSKWKSRSALAGEAALRLR